MQQNLFPWSFTSVTWFHKFSVSLAFSSFNVKKVISSEMPEASRGIFPMKMKKKFLDKKATSQQECFSALVGDEFEIFHMFKQIWCSSQLKIRLKQEFLKFLSKLTTLCNVTHKFPLNYKKNFIIMLVLYHKSFIRTAFCTHEIYYNILCFKSSSCAAF